jgi:methyl-accepting chemotaxis protein
MQASTGEAVTSIGGITATIAQMSEITASISTAIDQQGDATRELDTQSGMLRSAVDEFLQKVRAA